MRYTALSAILLAAVAANPALADDHAEAAKPASMTIDTPIEALMANEATKAVVVKHLGALNDHPAYAQFKSMSLVQLQPFSQGAITQEAIDKIKTDLAALS